MRANIVLEKNKRPHPLSKRPHFLRVKAFMFAFPETLGFRVRIGLFMEQVVTK